MTDKPSAKIQQLDGTTCEADGGYYADGTPWIYAPPPSGMYGDARRIITDIRIPRKGPTRLEKWAILVSVLLIASLVGFALGAGLHYVLDAVASLIVYGSGLMEGGF